MMHQLMTEETPGKLVGLLAGAMFSMALMFTVTVTDASFAGTDVSIPNPFSAQNVVAVIDRAAAGYSTFLHQNLIDPAQSDYRLVADNLGWVASNASDGLATLLGVDVANTDVQDQFAVVQRREAKARVAGVSTQRYQPGQSFSIDTIYGALGR